MADRKFTLIEYHNHDGSGISLFPNLEGVGPFGGDEWDDAGESETATEEPESTDESGGNGMQLLIAIVLIVGIALAVRRLRGDGEETIDYESDDVEVTEYER